MGNYENLYKNLFSVKSPNPNISYRNFLSKLKCKFTLSLSLTSFTNILTRTSCIQRKGHQI